jgi:uncharacterized membrane protein
MPCPPDELRHVPLFSLLDDDELAVLAMQVEMKRFMARQRIYKMGEVSNCAYLLLSGEVQVSTLDEDHQEVIFDQPRHGDLFGFAAMIEQVPHRTTAVATSDTVCLEVDRNDISTLLSTKPMAGLDMMTVMARQFHEAQELIRVRAARNPNVVFEEEETFGERIADKVASFGGSWSFIILFTVVLLVYITVNNTLGSKAWDVYPYILLNLFLSMIAAIQAPVIMMSQNRQDKKDRLRSELDFEVNVRAESEIQSLSRRMAEMQAKLDDVDELVRSGKS